MDAKEFITQKQRDNDVPYEQWMKHYWVKIMQEYAEMKCKEQKEIDIKAFPSHKYKWVSMDIYNAPLATDEKK